MDFYYLLSLPVTTIIAILAVFICNKRYVQLHDRIFLAMEVCEGLVLFITLRTIVDGFDADYNAVVYDNVMSLTTLLIFPLLFLYMRTMAQDAHWRSWYWWLFAPGIVICATGIVLSCMLGWDRILEIRHTNDYGWFVPNPDNIVEELYKWINIDIFNYTVGVMAVVLVALSIYHLVQYHKKAEDFFANIEDSCVSKLNWFLISVILQLLQGLSGLLMTILMPEDLFSASTFAYGTKVELIVSSTWITFLLCVTAYNAYQIRLSEQSLMGEGYPDPLGSEIIDDDILGQRIAEWEARKDKPFCKEGITLVVLAKELGVSRQALSAYINSHKGLFRFAPEHLLERKNFNLWINSLRVEEAKRLLRISKDPKIGYISNICGFNAQASFTRTFHKIVGMTPQDYRDSI